MFRLSFNSDIVETGSLLANDNLYLMQNCVVLSVELIIQTEEPKNEAAKGPTQETKSR